MAQSYSPPGYFWYPLRAANLRDDESSCAAALGFSTQGYFSALSPGHGTFRAHVLYRATDRARDKSDRTEEELAPSSAR